MNSIFLIAIVSIVFPLQQSDYDPSTSSGAVTVVDAEFEYGNESRIVPLRMYLPEKKTKAPVILFSHGLGGAKDNNPYLGNHWAGRGYVVVFMQHAGSDESIWKDVPRRERFKKLKTAASRKSLEGRTGDVPATLDQLKKWNSENQTRGETNGKTNGQSLVGRLNLEKVGLSGHSFGAVTTQAVSGQNYGRQGQIYSDARIKAAVAMSPSTPQFGNSEATFGKVEIPWLLMTGTKDKSIIARTTPEDRRKVYQQLPERGHFFELVLDGAEHMAFSETKLTGGSQRNPSHHKSILGLSSAFWDAYLKDEQAAKEWLKSDSVRTFLEPKDIWQQK